MLHRHVLRIVTLLLLAWIALDLAAIDTCALDLDRQPVSARQTLQAPAPDRASAHPRAVLHPDHCFCHGVSTGPGSSASLTDPRQDRAVPDVPPGHLLQASSALYHPPQHRA